MELVDEYAIEDVKVAKNELSGVRDTDFKIGETVRIRSWSDMEKEYGLTIGGSINCKSTFITNMIHLCGLIFKITEIRDSEIQCIEGWTITTDMIEKV